MSFGRTNSIQQSYKGSDLYNSKNILYFILFNYLMSFVRINSIQQSDEDFDLTKTKA